MRAVCRCVEPRGMRGEATGRVVITELPPSFCDYAATVRVHGARKFADFRTEAVGAVAKKAVEPQHGGTATFITNLPVKQVLDGKTVWDGVVHIFDLETALAGTLASRGAIEPIKALQQSAAGASMPFAAQCRRHVSFVQLAGDATDGDEARFPKLPNCRS